MDVQTSLNLHILIPFLQPQPCSSHTWEVQLRLCHAHSCQENCKDDLRGSTGRKRVRWVE